MEKLFYKTILKVRNSHFLLIDLIFLSVSPLLALLLRLENFAVPVKYVAPLVLYTLVSLLIKMSVFNAFHFYNRFWRYASVDEIATLAIATVSSWMGCILVFFWVLRPTGLIHSEFPGSIPLIDGILTMLVIGGLRFGIRIVYVFNERGRSTAATKNVLIVGAGVAGSMIVKELRSNPQLGLVPVGFVDDDRRKQQMYIHGIEVMGSIADIGSVVKLKNISEVIIAMPTVSGKVIRDVVEVCKNLKIRSKTIPGVYEILSGSAVAQLRDVSIEDLLRRDIVTIDEENVENLICGARVMVTGAGGSIGSEMCRQIARFRPKELIMLGHGEDSIFLIANEMKNKQGVAIGASVKFTTVIADIRDRERMVNVMDDLRPQIIFHAAAHKHVGLMEVNTPDAVTNNVMGTQILTELAARFGVQKLVMISSDKAVNPMCVMGVTKRIAELVVGDAATRNEQPFVVVRFGNVLGSRGSVVPIFQNQIRLGGPVTITHPDVSRFFMTIPEAVRLVLQAGALGTGGETFVLDMGEPVKIVDLARDLIRLSGLQEGTDIDIKFTGLLVGEKMHEELFYKNEHAVRSKHEKIFVCLNGHAETNKSEGVAAVADLQPGKKTNDADNGAGSKAGKKTKGTTRPTDRQREAFLLDIDLLLNAARAGNAECTNILLKKIIPEYSNPSLEKQNAESLARAAALDESVLPGVGAEKEQDIIITFPHGHSSAGMPDRQPVSKPLP
jgi:FlaA1/EpsC-like NDP-sugar epimerase